MALLFVVYTSNFIDRTILSVLQQPIKEDLKLSDAQLGVLGGFAFAVLYSTLGVPIARLAESRSRKTIITASLVIWSAMTALCGFAQNYMTLFAFRVGVGVGEAGASPPAHSLIADYFPPRQRATALSIYSLGIPIGVLAGSVLGGLIAQRYGWRPAFMVVGVPGLLLALLTQTTLREPPRGFSEGGEAAGAATPSFREVLARLASRRSFLHVAAGCSLASFANYGIGAFAAPYFIRTFHLGLAQAGVVLGVISGAAAAIGTLGGGVVTDRLGRKDRRWYVWVPAIGLLAGAPLLVAGYLAPSWPLAVALLSIPPVIQYSYLGPSFGVMHNMVTPRMRATATALLFLVINFIGLGFGPTLVGVASDLFAAHHFAAPLGVAGDFKALCPGGRAATGAPAGLNAACLAASAYGVRWAIVSCTAIFAWAALHYALAARDLRQDLIET
jgi:MFS family permease